MRGCRQTAAPMPSYDEGSVCRSGPVIQSAPPKCVRDTVSHQEHADVLVPEHQHRSIAIPATRVARVQHLMGGSMWTQVLRKRSHRGLLICTQPGPLDTEVVRQGLVPAHTEDSVFLHARHQSSHRVNSSEIHPGFSRTGNALFDRDNNECEQMHADPQITLTSERPCLAD